MGGIKVVLPPSYWQVQEDGVDLTMRRILNFATNVTASDDAGNGRTNVNASGGAGITPTYENLTGSGTSFALSSTPSPAGTETLYYRSFRLRRVGSSPGINEYTISGVNITLGFSKDAAQPLEALYFV